jgi:hypothetical protein
MMVEDFDRGFLLLDPTGKLAEEIADRAPVQRTCYISTRTTSDTRLALMSLMAFHPMKDEKKVERR